VFAPCGGEEEAEQGDSDRCISPFSGYGDTGDGVYAGGGTHSLESAGVRLAYWIMREMRG
jgi:hypothetical protein